MSQSQQQEQKVESRATSSFKGPKDIIEFNALSAERKLQYLRAYWDKASEFFGFKEFVLPDEEVYVQIKKFKEKPKPRLRRVVKLGEWKWKLDPKSNGVREGYFRTDYDDATWEKVNTPHNVNFAPTDPVVYGTIDSDAYNYPSGKPTTVYLGEYSSWYRASVPLNENEIAAKRAFLSFESCSIKTTAWLNEWPVIVDHYGLYPFQTEVTEELRKARGDLKEIALEIKSQPTNAPDFFYNCLEYAYPEKRGEKDFETPCLNWGGINGSIELSLTSPVYVRDLFVYAKAVSDGRSILHVKLEIENTTTDAFQGSISLAITPWYPEEIEDEKKEIVLDINARPLGTTVVETDLEVKNPRLWESWNPNLYLAHATLSGSEEGPCDDLYDTFGIRTFEAKQGKFFLNNKEIFMSAVHDQGNYPNNSPTCPDDYWIVQGYLLHKAMGFVASRFPSDNRVHYRRIADLADQMGIMLIWEGYCSVWTQNPEIEDLARRDVPAMIRDLRNHPSIVTWVMGDETFYAHPARSSENTYRNKREHYNELVHKLATENDPSRLINPVGCWAEDLTMMIENLVAKGASVTDARSKVLEMLPIFASKNVYWSIHKNPGHTNNEPVYATMRRYHEIICGTETPVTFDEFGCEGMPDWALSTPGDWWYKRWTITPLLAGGFKTIEEQLVGKKMDLNDWQISQAYQATILFRAISYMRETEAFAGFGTGCLRDAFNFYIGLVDFRGRAKLVYFTTKDVLDRFFISAMHGNFVFKRRDQLQITACNSESSLQNGKLVIEISNQEGTVKEVKTLQSLTVPHGVTKILNYDLGNLPPDLYFVQYLLLNNDNSEIGRSMDLFFVD